MKHASAKTLASLAELLERLRALGRLAERKPGSFYLGSRAFLHFHEDPAGLFADARLNLLEFTRLEVNTRAEQGKLVEAVQEALAVATASRRSKG